MLEDILESGLKELGITPEPQSRRPVQNVLRIS
jgi:hypothetical protein